MAYTYKQTSAIVKLVIKIREASALIKNLPISPQRQLNLRRSSTLQSSLFSARIEGNQLELHQFTSSTIINTRDRQKLEVANILTALNFIFSPRAPKKLSISLIKKFHSQILKDFGTNPGQFRSQQTGIFNQAGVAVYSTPPPQEIRPKLSKLISFVNSPRENYLIKAAKAHFWFERIHPFEDGNGRVGRLISQFILDRAGKNFKGLLAFEKHIDQFRSEYYSLLQSQDQPQDITSFVEFFLECVDLSTKDPISKLKTPATNAVEDSLLPRRRELLDIIRDHKLISFNQLHRRFFAVKPSTLRYDLRQLIKAGLVKKLGLTRGALYKPAPS